MSADLMTPEDLRIRGARGQQLLDDQVLTAAFAAVEADAIEAISSGPLFDGDRLAEHAALLKAVRAVREQLQSFVTSGAAAAKPRSPRA